MSVCMRSAQAAPRRLCAASRTSPITPLSRSRISNSGLRSSTIRWNSGKAGASLEIGAKSKKGWTGFSVLALMGVSAVAAGAVARWQGGQEKSGSLRDYSNSEKFVQPKYASIRDMEAVSNLLNFSSTSIQFSELGKPDS